MKTSGPEPDAKAVRSFLPVFADRNDVVLDLDVGIGLLELGDDGLVDRDPRRMIVQPDFEGGLG